MAPNKTDPAGAEVSHPAQIMEMVRQLRAQADEMEEGAICDALRRCGGFESRAAELLKMPRSTLKTLLLHRLKELGEEARRLRGDDYKGGNPHRPK